METFKAAAASIRSEWGRTRQNIARAVEAIEWAGRIKARLLLLPECCLTGGNWPTGAKSPSVREAAIDLDGPEMGKILAATKRSGVVAGVGFYERLKGQVRISQALAGPAGLIGVYRKVHEAAISSRDRELFPVFDLGFARVGISVCRDNMLPECARILALKGAEVLLSPFMSLPLTRKSWERMRLLPLRVRAQDNRFFVISASHAMPRVPGKPPDWGYSGICCAIDPLGNLIKASAGKTGRPQRIAVTLDERLFNRFEIGDAPSLLARRPADYRELTDKRLQTKLQMKKTT